jgi:hypothetical protein
MHHALRVLLLVLPALGAAPHAVAGDPETAIVRSAYLELHTGPGRGFPRDHAVAQGDEIELLARRTDWVRIRAPRGVTGWVPRRTLQAALGQPAPEPVDWLSLRALGERERGFEAGVDLGDFQGASLISAWTGYSLNESLMVQAEAGQFMGNVSDGWLGAVNVVHRPFPSWRIAPYFMVGTGLVQTDPRSTLVQSEARDEELLQAGLGADVWIARSLILRIEYRNVQISTDRDEREEVNQWKAGVSFQF